MPIAGQARLGVRHRFVLLSGNTLRLLLFNFTLRRNVTNTESVYVTSYLIIDRPHILII
jgi:hypothetical protein